MTDQLDLEVPGELEQAGIMPNPIQVLRGKVKQPI